MTAMIAAVIPPSGLAAGTPGEVAARALRRRPLPLPDVPRQRDSRSMYGLATLDCHGRLADRKLIAALGWKPGTRLAISETGGLFVVEADRRGVFAVIPQGHIRLPATIRHWCRLTAGDRVLLVADPDAGRLVVHPPAALDAMVGTVHEAVLGGDPE